jgi:D-inositol-3-phosphate glycosyltransferase
MRVLLVCHYFPPHVGGIETVAYNEARGLARSGVDVTVLTSGARHDVTWEHGYRLVRVPVWNEFERRMRVPFPVFAPRVVREAHHWANRADVVHVHDAFYLSSWAGGTAAALTRTPLVMTQHVAMVEHRRALVRGAQRAVYATAGRALVRHSRCTAVLNAGVGSFVRSLGAPRDRVVHLPNGVDTALFRPVEGLADKARIRAGLGLPTDAVLVLFVGRPVQKKGYDLLLEAMPPGAEVVCVGDAPADGPPSRSHVHHLGPMAPARLAEVYRACDVFALPSTAEGFPLTVQEAMASGLPIVTTDDPGYAPYELDRSRVALVPRDAGALRRTLVDLACDSARRQEMGAYSSAYALRQFSWPVHVERLRALYRQAADSHVKGAPR